VPGILRSTEHAKRNSMSFPFSFIFNDTRHSAKSTLWRSHSVSHSAAHDDILFPPQERAFGHGFLDL